MAREYHQISAGSADVTPLQGLTAGLVPAVTSSTATFYSTVKDERYSKAQPIAAVASNPKNRRELCKSSFFWPKHLRDSAWAPRLLHLYAQTNTLSALVLTRSDNCSDEMHEKNNYKSLASQGSRMLRTPCWALMTLLSLGGDPQNVK